MGEHHQLKCRECGKLWGNIAQSFCEECLSPLEVTYDMDVVRGTFTRKNIAAGPANLWRYSAFLPLQDGFSSTLPTGLTPLVEARRLSKLLGAKTLYIKNDAVCFPTLSFKDRVVAVALAAARRFGFEVVSCSSTGNLANLHGRAGSSARGFTPVTPTIISAAGAGATAAKAIYDLLNRYSGL